MPIRDDKKLNPEGVGVVIYDCIDSVCDLPREVVVRCDGVELGGGEVRSLSRDIVELGRCVGALV